MINFKTFEKIIRTKTTEKHLTRTNKFKHYCYELYKMDWLLSHGHTLTDAINSIIDYTIDTQADYSIDYPRDNAVNDIREDWEGNIGIHGMIYVCYNEFLETEFEDVDYMRNLLSAEDLILYMNLRQNHKLED